MPARWICGVAFCVVGWKCIHVTGHGRGGSLRLDVEHFIDIFLMFWGDDGGVALELW